jgi:hypothetical protein
LVLRLLSVDYFVASSYETLRERQQFPLLPKHYANPAL